MYSSKTSISLCTAQQNTKKGNTSVGTICNVSVMKKPSLIIKNSITMNGAQAIKMPKADNIVYFKSSQARSVLQDLGLNILLYEKQTRLINSLLDGQEMRNGKPSLKSFCDLGLKLESCWVTHRYRPDDVDRFLHL